MRERLVSPRRQQQRDGVYARLQPVDGVDECVGSKSARLGIARLEHAHQL